MLDGTRARRLTAIQLSVVDACLSLLAGLALVSLGTYGLFIAVGISW